MKRLVGTTRDFADALLNLDSDRVTAVLADVISDNGDPRSIDEVVVPALERIGQAWEDGRVALSQVYMAGRICEHALGEVLPADQSMRAEPPRLAIGVLEDHHALGKRMVLSALRSTGYRLRDYGHGLKADALVERAVRERIDVLLVSCLMLASALRVAEVVKGLKEASSPCAVVVGGAPFRLAPRLWQEVGAQAVGTNSAEAVRIVQALTEGRS